MPFDRFTEKPIISSFEPIFLDEMKGVELMNRVDTKFLIGRSVFNEILKELAVGYKALEIKGEKMIEYSTLYFDTPRFQLYLDHHNSRVDRFKVRIRNYVSSGLFYLEIKHKYKGRTDKNRISLPGFEEDLQLHSREFIHATIGHEVGLESKLWNSFDRITLVSKTDKERLTIDLNLTYRSGDNTVVKDEVVVAELKQEKLNRNSLFYQLMKKNQIRPHGFSKYCIGAVTLYDDLKYNNFKEHQLLLNKLK
ncbi:MAG: polyphosphate polymerase domain-containing protein [Crocinitomicaceae bacterium]|nr:polyphosphate polymerase domain-containing protein [Crocinitomicaceae bacterium]